MLTASSISEYRAWRKSLKLGQGDLIGFFPTMGALHEGHLDLCRAAKEKCAIVVSSIFVNPAQFAPHEDLDKYPRQQEEDLAKLRALGVDMVFLPNSEMMYPPGYDTWVQADVGSGRNEGAVRPHFFRGVATVCTKLFNIVQPDVVFFGQKDAQQCVVIQHIVRDLNMDVEVVIVPTRREQDGLAMSSRNQYLTKDMRERAPIVYRALCKAKDLIEVSKERDANKVREAMKEVLSQEPLVQLQYASVLSTETLLELDEVESRVLIAIAVMLGSTRLIDNMIVHSG